MKSTWTLIVVALTAAGAAAQEPVQNTPRPAFFDAATGQKGEVIPVDPKPTVFEDMPSSGGSGGGGMMSSNRNFPGFIGFLSNPLQNIDPRALTQMWPMFGSTWVTPFPPLPSGDMQVYGAGLNVALTDRLSIGANQGGWAASHFNRKESIQIGKKQFNLSSGDRDGWLNLGGFAQYTLIEDVPNQFLFTVGMRLEVPTGEAEVFQGHGPCYLAPYLTFGKEFCNFHVLATAGYQFPTGSGRDTVRTFYTNVHFDYRLCSWIYPVLEFNWSESAKSTDLSLDSRRGFFSFGTFDTTGNLVTIAPGINFVLIQDRLEIGGCYTTPLAAQKNFDFDGLLVKMILRF